MGPLYVKLPLCFDRGCTGLIEVARMGSATNSSGLNYDLDTIATCVVGKVSCSGSIASGAGRIKPPRIHARR